MAFLVSSLLMIIDVARVVLVMHLPCDFEKKVGRTVNQSRR